MPNFLYASARTKFLWGGINWTTNSFGILFLNGTSAAGGSANIGVGNGTIGVGTTGWYGSNQNSGPFVADINTGWRARGAAAGGTAFDLNSRTYIASTGVTATPFVPTGGGYGYTVDGEARGNNVTFAAVAQSFGTLTSFVLFRDLGNESASDLIAYFDQATNLPIPANGGDITIQWSTNPNYIYKL
jgi:hypothetical protein